MVAPIRINAEEARTKNQESQALLVCAYEERNKFKDNHLEGAISWQRFESKIPSLDKSAEIIFYCA